MISSLVFMNIFILIILCLMFLPKRKIKLSLSKVIGYVLQWFLIPFFGIFLTTIPALLVQIRLMKKSFSRNNQGVKAK
jgi:predicted membrane protein